MRDLPHNGTEPVTKALWLIAPADIELPSGFPFTKLNGSEADILLAALQTREDVVVPVSAERIEVLKALAPVFEYGLRHLEHTVGDYSAYWHMHSKSIPSLTVQEIMETREARNPGQPPKLAAQDLANYDSLLSTLEPVSGAEDAGD